MDELKKDITDAEEDAYVDSLKPDTKDGSVITGDTQEVDAAVDQVVRDESDRLLKSDDEKLERQFEPPKRKKTWKERLIAAAQFWWEHKTLRYGTLFGLFILLAASVLFPAPRYFILNTAGVRVESSMSIVDSQTGLPLGNIQVSLQGQELRSNDDGFVQFSDLKLGSSKLVVDRRGYAPYEKDLVLGWGSNPLGDQPLIAIGTQFTFVLTDWLSGTPIVDAEAKSGEDVALVDSEGRIVLTVGELGPEAQATIYAEGYREEIIQLSEVDEELPLNMVPAKKHVFVSNRTGQYDLYRIDADGKNEEVLLASTGNEREIPHVLSHPTKAYAAYISTREGEVNSDGFILDGLYIVDVNTGNAERIARSEQLQVIGWAGDLVIYTAVVEGVSGGNPERSKLFSFNVDTGDKTELASSNYFNDIELVGDRIYYSVSSFAVPLSAAKLFSVRANGTDQKTVVDMQVWTIVRAAFDVLHFRAVDANLETQWYTQQGAGDPSQLDAAPVTQTSRRYSTSPNGQHAVWVDQRDG